MRSLLNKLTLAPWILIAWVAIACNRAVPTTPATPQNPGTTTQLPYPHAGNFAAPENHGVNFLKSTPDQRKQCLACHGPGRSATGSVAAAISCETCHQHYPHDSKFLRGGHKEFARKSEENCAGCHARAARDLPSHAPKMQCSKCHGEGFPHPYGWANPKSHGEFYIKLDADGRESCMDCHSPESFSPDDAVQAKTSCVTCHEAFPHSKEFLGSHAKLAGSYLGKCEACHTGLKRNMPNAGEEGCRACHTGDLKIGWKQSVSGSAGDQLWRSAPVDKEATTKAQSAISENRKPATKSKKKGPRSPKAKSASD